MLPKKTPHRFTYSPSMNIDQMTNDLMTNDLMTIYLPQYLCQSIQLFFRIKCMQHNTQPFLVPGYCWV